MGGNALKQKGLNTDRVNTDTFLLFYNNISFILKEELELTTHMVECYQTKKTHGDLDILVKMDSKFNQKNVDLKKWVENRFKPKAIVSNGGVISFEYHNFQIDLVMVRESNWDIAKVFFSFSPLGNLMGKLAHKFNLKNGFQGLEFAFRNFNGRLSTNITISKNPEKIFTFLGFDYQRYLKGFNTEEEIFDYVINSKYFDKKNFQYENLNRIDRKRNLRRPDYNRFLEYVNNIKNLQSFKYKKKSDYVYIIDQHFPESRLIEKLDELKNKDNENKLLNSKFNGNIVMDVIPELKGKELGKFISDYKEYVGEKWREFFLNNEIQDIIIDFKKYYYEREI